MLKKLATDTNGCNGWAILNNKCSNLSNQITNIIIVEINQVNLLIFDPNQEMLLEWIS